ncbi:MAG: propanediol utilization protein [Candidatus Cloacimonadota bacterium]|nr:MAG: propanediol utilization protein [Candidatus Cloacimonadota bacterium]
MAHNAIGLLEVSSIARGYEVQDAMLKAADVELMTARSICSGKFMIVIAGQVSEVQASVAHGIDKAKGVLIEELVIPNIHGDVFKAIGGSINLEKEDMGALGVLETFSVASIVEAADAAAKTSDGKLFRVHLAMAVGGKGFMMITGDLSSVTASIDVATEAASKRGMVVAKVVIASPRKELFKEYI